MAAPLAIVAILASGCELVGRDDAAAIDAALDARLSEVSPDGGRGYFLLPDEGDLAALPQDPRNPITAAKVELGRLLFHDAALGVDARHAEHVGEWSCATCHHARAGFQAGIRQGIGEGGIGFGTKGETRRFDPEYLETELDVQPIRSPSILNCAFQEVMLWNGQFGASGVNAGTMARWTPGSPKETNYLGFEGVETQAIAGLSIHRMGSVAATVVSTDPAYLRYWEGAFPGITPNPVDAGLAIAAFERSVVADRAPWQRWLRGTHGAMTYRQKQGALLFFGKADCVACHTGPALNSMSFHALGMADLAGSDVRFDPRDLPKPRGRGAFTGESEDDYRFKTPQLYNLQEAVFLGHGASFSSVRAVIEYKNRGLPEAPVPPSSLSPLFRPLALTDGEVEALTDFVENALRDPDLRRYEPESVPSGACIPVNDALARQELGCLDASPRGTRAEEIRPATWPAPTRSAAER